MQKLLPETKNFIFSSDSDLKTFDFEKNLATVMIYWEAKLNERVNKLNASRSER